MAKKNYSMMVRAGDREHDKFWQEYVELAKEFGFRTVQNNILLPFGEVAGVEYGICVKKSNLEVLYSLALQEGEHILKEVAYPYVYSDRINLDLEAVKVVESGPAIDCYKHDFVVKTAEHGDKKYVIEKQRKLLKKINSIAALMTAVKFKDLGTLDNRFVMDVYFYVLGLLPQNLAEELAENKISELEEKLGEIDELASALPKEQVSRIKTNIMEEWEAMYQLAFEFESFNERKYNYTMDAAIRDTTFREDDHLIRRLELVHNFNRGRQGLIVVDGLREELRKRWGQEAIEMYDDIYNNIWNVIDEEHDKSMYGVTEDERPERFLRGEE